MPKLFIEPPHGSLGKTMDALRKEGYEPQLVGYGYPPMYIEDHNDGRFEQAKEIATNISTDVKFQTYRADQIETNDLNKLIIDLGPDKFIILCDNLQVTRQALAGFAIGNLSQMVADLVSQHKNDKKREKLVAEVYKLDPELF